MGKLTPEARKFAVCFFSLMNEAELKSILENELCIQCYDNETKEEWAESIVVSVEAGDIGAEFICRENRNNYRLRMLFDEIDEIWE